jgi:hypothetical protein
MKNQVLNAVIAGVFGLASAQAMATGFVNLPTTGFSVSGGTSAYTPCNTTGGFGQSETTEPTPSANNTCAVFPDNGHRPDPNYTKILDTTRTVNMNNSYTGNTNKYVIELHDEVWWRSGTNEYIFASKYNHKNIDYDTTQGGTQYFEVNDFQRAGFSGRSVSAAYYFQDSADEAIFRVGRTNTGVATEEGGEAQPLTSEAPIDVNWVDFMTDTNWLDDDGTSLKNSPWMYVKTTITPKSGYAAGHTANIQTLSGAVRFYQAGQEGQPLITLPTSAYAPHDANAN